MKKHTLRLLSLIITVTFIAGGCGVNSQAGSASNSAAGQGPAAQSTSQQSVSTQNTPAGSGSKTEKKTVTLAVAQESNELSGIWGVADKQKYIEEELDKVGYQLKVLGFAAAGPAVNEAFVSGKIDLAYYGNLPPVVLKSKGIDVSIVSIVDSQYNFSVIVPAGSTVKTPKDLEGKRVIVGKGTIIDEYWGNLVKAYGIETGKVKVINDVANANSTFISGNADALISADFAAHLINKQFPIKVIETTSASHPEFASQLVVAASGKFSKEHPEVVTALLKAYIRGYDYSLQHRDEALKAFATNSIPLDVVEKVYSNRDKTFVNLDGGIEQADKERLKKLNDFLLEYKYIEKSADVNSLVDTGFFEKALKELGK